MFVNDKITTYNGNIIYASKNTYTVKTQAPQISNELMDIQQCAHKCLQDQNKGLDSTPAEADKKALRFKISASSESSHQFFL